MGAVKRQYKALAGSKRATTNTPAIPFNWFGSVAVGREPVYCSMLCKGILQDKFGKLCEQVLAVSRNTQLCKNSHIQNALITVLPRLAAANRTKFVSLHLEETMAYTYRCLQGRERDRYNALMAIGLLSVAAEKDIKKYLPNILQTLKNCLPQRDSPTKKRSSALDPAIFACISFLARAVKGHIKTEVREMLDPMMAVGLSPALTSSLRELATYLPSLKREIADGLLKILSLILMQQPFRHPGTPKHLMPPGAGGLDPPDSQSVVLGLNTLGSFDFEGHSLLQFVRHCADTYLHSEEKEIRLEAVKTCSSLLRSALLGAAGRKSPTVLSTINEVLAKLLIVGITDSDPDVRFSVLDCLNDCFDFHLAQAENISALFIAMNDEQFEIRELAICIIGRLSILNPAYIMPSLRVTLIQLLIELEHSGMGRNKEQASRLLGHLVANAPKLIRSYVEPILKVLIPKLKEADLNPMVVASVLRAVGDLSQVGGPIMKGYVGQLLPILLEFLSDASSSQKREVSLWTLSQLVESTGCVVEPYNKHPQLLVDLLNFLRTEQRPAIRKQTLGLLGLLGALDPYKHRMNLGQIDTKGTESAPLIPINQDEDKDKEVSTSEMLVSNASLALDDFYPSVAISTLMRIIRDPTLSQHHTSVVQAVTFIFKSLGIKAVPYISQVIPSMMTVIRTSDNAFRDFLFGQLGFLIGIVKQHIRNYLDDIFTLIKEFWTLDSPLQSTIILLVEAIAVALGSEFKVYLPQLIPHILRVLTHDSSRDKQVTHKMLSALIKFGPTLDDYIHLVLPPMVKLFDCAEVPWSVRRSSLEAIDKLSDTLDFSEYAGRIIHPLVRCIDNSPELRPAAMDALAAIVLQLGKKFKIFIPMVDKVLKKHRISHQRYELLAARVMKGGSTFEIEDPAMVKFYKQRPVTDSTKLSQLETSNSKKLYVSAAHLQRAWAVSRRVSKDDWLEWHRRLSIELLKESPSPALRSCWTVAQQYAQLARDLFNASFVSCWTELEAGQQDELMASLEQALVVPDLPEISQTILNLAEFMEHCDNKGPLPLDPAMLGEQAMKCRAYAKALHYKESEFHKEPTVPVLEALISINNKLGQKEAAAGLLEWGRKNLQGELKVRERWYEKLHEWDKALEAYKRKEAATMGDNIDPEVLLGQMRCLEALGEWSQLHTLSETHWDKVGGETRQRMARMASTAAWGRGEWAAMGQSVSLLPRDSQDGAFYRAVLGVHSQEWDQAYQLIDITRDMLDTELTALSAESYQRAYPIMVQVQMLAELEEVIEYKQVPDRRQTIKDMWWARLQGCQRVVEDWQRILQVRSLVLEPADHQRTWLKYASLCRKSHRLKLSHKTLVTILGVDPSLVPDQPLPTTIPQATFAYCKHLWGSNQQERAFSQLHNFVKKTLHPRSVQLAAAASPDEEAEKQLGETRKLLARCYLKLGSWQESLQGLQEASIPTVLQYYTAATEHDSSWYKAWHAWAVMNFETVLFYKLSPSGLTPAHVSLYGVPALQGFVRSIALSSGSSLQDALRLLTLWFDYGQHNDMYEALNEGLRTIDINTWLQVIPQLIARIDTPRIKVSRLIHQLLTDVGKHHPQALIYPLTVASKSSAKERKNAANKILNKMKEHSESLVNQAVMVSDELIRVAILWHEQWHEGLEEASRLFFGERDVAGMFATLEPLHAMMDKGPQTLKETSFSQAYGNDLTEAQKWCKRYKVSNNIRDLNQAWDLYYHVFRRISRQLPQLTQLELQYVSPKLLLCRDLELAMPGSYVPNQDIKRIASVSPSLQVITSKQRPRKLCMKGSEGKEYMFLLKGHEDLRQDERVMQFFSLVNSLLTSDPETLKRNLTIQRFSVVPLSTNSGLIGWVPQSDTLHALIRDYREKKKVLLNIEHRIMLRMAPDYDHLPLMNKVEVFEHSLENTAGDDLAKLLLLKSPSSEVWFDRRTNFTRSLAVMSMVGYVLGLGDRHPSNLLLDRNSGKILHIDFGDCFEVAMTREKFPEKIPFRLTRMLINAMEVTGIEGTYRSTCESTMEVLRRNKDSLMAVLEAFVYDPLLNWRLIDNKPKSKKSKPHGEGVGLSVTSKGQMSGAGSSDSNMESLVEYHKEIVSKKNDSMGESVEPEALNKKALDIVQRVRDKLTGRDFNKEESLEVAEQVDLLIVQATSHENLCQCYIGWCPFW
eukprot:GFUD01021504.1.p1 GENE.GFUD01021504.1~~GFUD01021504.1.p1  ORF type:complete len:2235 (+),score=707.01 GFUD01021504.1:192-6707(+)